MDEIKKDQEENIGSSETPNPASEELEVKSWMRTIAASEQWRDGVGSKAGWRRFIAEYKNDWNFLQANVSIPLVPLNLVFSYVKTEIARLYFRDPWITVNAKRYEDIGAAQIAEQILNYTWGELKLKSQMKLALLETLLVGHSWIKVGYSAEFGTIESHPKDQAPPKRGRPSKEVNQVETNEYVKSENVFAYHVPYKDIIFDPSATFPATHNARWMAHRVVKPLRAVVESGIYENTDLLKSGGTIISPDAANIPYDTPASVNENQGKDVKSVVLWEIYDLDHQVITTVSPGCPRKLREIPMPEYLAGGFPFVQFSFNPVPGEVYPMSDIAPHEGQIIEMIKLVSIEINHLKRWNRQLIVRSDTFSETEMSKFKDAVDGGIIMTEKQEPLAENVMVVPYAPVQSDIYGVFTQVYQLWQMISGQTSTDQGGQAKTQTRTLGELRLSMTGTKSRSEEKIDSLEDSIEEVARKLLTIMQKKYDLPKIARIVGPKAVREKIMKSLPQRPSAQPNMPQDPAMSGQSQTQQAPNPVAGQSFGSEFGFSWNRQDIMGDMDVDVLAGSTVPLDRENQLKILEAMLPVLQAAGVQPGSPAAKAYAREMTRLAGLMSMETVMDIADNQPPQPPPGMMEVQAKVQATQAETQMKLQAKNQENQMKLQSMAQQNALKAQQMQQKLQVDTIKNQMDLRQQQQQMQMDVTRSLIDTFSKPNGTANKGDKDHDGKYNEADFK